MANSDKDILITPNTGQSAKPKIEVTGANDTTKAITVNDDGSLTFNSTIAATSGSVADGNTNLVTGDAVFDYIAAQGFTTEVGDITAVTAGTGLSGGGTSGAVTLTNAGVTSIVAGSNISIDSSTGAVTITGTDTNTQLSTEQVQDIVGGMVDGGTETNIAVTYDDTNGKLNFVSTDTNTQLTTEEVQDIVGAMFTSNTETRISATYEDGDGTIDLVVDDMTADTQLSTEQVQDIVGAMFTGNTETGIAATYEDSDGTIDLVVSSVGDTTGNAATATALETARTIGGVSFDGTANINLPGVNTAGNQNTSGNAATSTLASTVTVSDSTANTNFPVVFHDESNALLDDTNALRYNPSTGTLLVPNLNVAGTTTQVNTVTMEAANAVVFEGATSDDFETTLTIVDPTADRTISLPNAGGTVAVSASGGIALSALGDITANLSASHIPNLATSKITSGTFADARIASSNITQHQGDITSLGTLTALTVDNISVDGATIGHTDDTDLMTLADGILTVAGTLQASQFRFNSNLRIGNPASNQIAIFTAGSERMRFDASGNVGIGTTTPSTALDVSGTVTVGNAALESNQFRINNTGGYAQVELGGSSGAFIDMKSPFSDDYDVRFLTQGTNLDIITANAASPIQLKTQGTTRLTVADATTTVANDLAVSGDLSVTGSYGLAAGDIPNLAASKITSGTFATARIADDAITAAKISTTNTADSSTDNHLLSYDDASGGFTLVASGGGGENNQNAFSNVAVSGQTTVAADSTTDTLTLAEGSNVTITTNASNDTVTIAATDTNTQLSTEQVQDIVGAMFGSNTETRITATYQDGDGTIDLVVDDMTADTNTQLSDEQVQDIVGAMFSSNTETRITATYQDGDGTVDLVVDNDLSNYDNSSSGFITSTLTTEQVQDIVGAMFTGNTETRVSATYQDGDGTIDLVVDDMTTDTNTNQLTTFTLTGDSGSNQTIAHGNTLDIAGGDGIATVVGSTDTVTVGLDIDGMTDIGAALADADLMIVDDGAGGTNRKATMSRLKTYMQNGLTFTTDTNLTTEEVQDIVGAMVSSNTETNIAVTYDDTNGKLNFASTDTNTQLTLLDQDDMSSNSATAAASQQSIKAYVDAEVAGLVASAPSALNTLNELAAALGDDADFSTTTATSLGNRLRVDVSNQGLTSTQQGNALTNLGITASLAEINILDDGLAASDIPNLATSKITSGTFADARIAQSNVTQHLAVGSGGGIGLSGKTFSLDIDGMTDIGAALVDADLMIVDDGAGGTNRKATMSRLKTYMQNNLTFTTNTNTQLSNEQVQDIAGGMFSSNTETLITATYQDGDGTIDLVVDNDLSNYDNSSSGFITATLTTEQVQDIVGAMFSSNTETRISATYQDGDGTIDLVANDMNFSVDDITGATSLTSGLASTDEFVINDAGVLKRMDVSVLQTYMQNSLTFTTNTNTQLSDEQVQDIVGAMFSSNTETGITATYQDSDGTVDLVVGTLNQDTTGNAATVTVALDESTNANNAIAFHRSDGTLARDGAFRFNPSLDTLTVPKIITSSSVDIAALSLNGQVLQVNSILDEDNLSSDSATALATQQSIKAYVDANAGGGGIASLAADSTPQLGGDLDVNGNKITSASNANVTIEPHGTGDILLYADTVIAGDASTDFALQHRTKTNSAMKFLNNGNNQFIADANIYLNADEAGNGGSLIRLNAITSQLGKSNTNAVLTTQGTGDLTLSTNGGTNSGTIKIADGVNGDITIAPNGTGALALTGKQTITVDDTVSEAFKVTITDTDSTDDSTPFIVDGDGRVGIGTASPVSGMALTLNGDGSSYEGIAWQVGGSTKFKQTTDGSSFYFDSSINTGNVTFRVRDSGGNLRPALGLEGDGFRVAVGYNGTSGSGLTPNNTLQVNVGTEDGVADKDDGILLLNSDLSIADGDTIGGIGFATRDGNIPSVTTEAAAGIVAYAAEDHSTGDKGGDLAFFTSPIDQDDDTASSERMRIDSEGHIGIGTATPSFTSGSGIEVSHATQANFRATDSNGASTDFATSGNDTYILNRHASGKIFIKPGNGDHSIELASNGQVKFNNAYTFPTSDGSANQVLVTNGSGTLSFANQSGGGSSTTGSFYITAEESNWQLNLGVSNGFHWSFGNGADIGDAPSTNAKNEGIALPVDCTLKFMHLNVANDGNETAGNSATVQIYKATAANANQSAVSNADITATIATNGHGISVTADKDIDFDKGDVILFRSTTANQAGIYIGRGTISAYFVER